MEEITIGDQVWMAENLSVDTFRNGDPIPEAKTDEEWVKAGENEQPAWCWSTDDPEKRKEYSKLYNWYAVNDPRGLAPEGWYIPSDDEWMTLIDYLGGEDEAGIKMKSTSGWNDDGNGTNESGFSGLPAGDRNGSFYNFGKCGYWWSSTEEASHSAWNRYLDYRDGNVYSFNYDKDGGLSVRCIKD